MAAKKYIVELDADERARLNAMISKGKASAKTALKARILLKTDQAEGGPGWLDAQIVEALDTNLTMVMRTREKLVTEGLDAVLTRKKRETPPVAPIFDGEAQAKLTALACSFPPAPPRAAAGPSNIPLPSCLQPLPRAQSNLICWRKGSPQAKINSSQTETALASSFFSSSSPIKAPRRS
jgi:hypothetical protein